MFFCTNETIFPIIDLINNEEEPFDLFVSFQSNRCSSNVSPLESIISTQFESNSWKSFGF